jgi:hypothetical protein
LLVQPRAQQFKATDQIVRRGRQATFAASRASARGLDVASGVAQTFALRRRGAEHTHAVQIRIEGRDLPGRSCRPGPDAELSYQNVHVGLQRRNRRDDLLGLVPGDSLSATWTVDCTAELSSDGVDLKGPYIQGPPGGRFIYLSWGTVDGDTFTLFRRAKLWFDAIPPHVMHDAVDLGVLVGRLGLTDRKGNPLCAAVRPPTIEWRAAAH